MAKYRIIERNYHNHTCYVVQKRLFGCLFWYNPYSDDWSSGEYNTFDEALKVATNLVAYDNHKITHTTVWEA